MLPSRVTEKNQVMKGSIYLVLAVTSGDSEVSKTKSVLLGHYPEEALSLYT